MKGRISLLLLALLLAFVALAGCSSDLDPAQAGGSPKIVAEVGRAARSWHLQIEVPGVTIGTLSIPRISLETVILEGTDDATLEKGPGHWEDTPLPGEGGRCVISGHRSTFGGPFLRLGELEPGDRIEFRLPYGVFEYEVVESVVVQPDQVEVVRQRGIEELSLATCHPPGSAEWRLVVQARAVGYRPAP
jgi:sortase A